MDKFSHYCGVCGNQVLEDENECWVCADETNDKENYMIKEIEIDPTRLSVSEDGRTVYLDGKPLVWGCEQKLPRGTWDSMEALSYLQYALNALAAHGSDFSYLRLDCEKPFVGRVMEFFGDTGPNCAARIVNICPVDGAICFIYKQGLKDRTLWTSARWLRPLSPPTQRRPMTPGEIVPVIEGNKRVITDPKGIRWIVSAVVLTGPDRGLEAFNDIPGGRRQNLFVSLAELAAENWRCGDQLLSVEE